MSIEYSKVVAELGTALATRNIDLVYGGGSLGLRGSVAVTANVAGSRILGIAVKPLAKRKDIIGTSISNEFQVTSIHGRMAYMLLNADAFIALLDGLETFEKIFNIASWAQS